MADELTECRASLRDAERRASDLESALKKSKKGQLKIAIWSAVGGFLLFALGGHWVPGYQLDSTAEETISETSRTEVGNVVAQYCARNFMQEEGLAERMTALDGENGDWSKATFIRNGSWGNTPEGESPTHDTAEKCNQLIAKLRAESAQNTSS